MIDAAKSIMVGVRDRCSTDSVFYDKSGEVLKRADQKVGKVPNIVCQSRKNYPVSAFFYLVSIDFFADIAPNY